jgi:hypothetical protein
VPLVEPRRGIGGNGRRRQRPLFAAHLGFLEGKRRGRGLVADLAPIISAGADDGYIDKRDGMEN